MPLHNTEHVSFFRVPLIVLWQLLQVCSLLELGDMASREYHQLSSNMYKKIVKSKISKGKQIHKEMCLIP